MVTSVRALKSYLMRICKISGFFSLYKLKTDETLKAYRFKKGNIY
jgi:hypothetical protein